MNFFSSLNNERGSALLIALLMLVILTLFGISSTTTTTFELQIAGNDKLFKRAFYTADGATEMAGELIEQNIEERDWETVDSYGNLDPTSTTDIDGAHPYYRGNVRIETENPYMNRDLSAAIPFNPTDEADPTTANRDFVYTADALDINPHTNIKVQGNTTLSTGSAVQLIAGYEGKGKGASGGGAWITYDVRAYHQDVRNTEVKVLLGWRHVM